MAAPAMSKRPTAFLRQLAAIVVGASTRELMPRYRKLGEDEVMAKPTEGDPADLVTVADQAAERYISERLLHLLPGSLVVGEEAVAADETVLRHLNGQATVWLVDPLDGTRYFAAGNPPFGPMVALVERGEILAAAIHLPLADDIFLAARGQGAFRNGARLERAPIRDAPLRGMLFTKFMPPDLAATLTSRQAPHTRVDAPLVGAHMYPAIARGYVDYAVYFRLLPWDHAAGALILREAGGVSRHPDGRDYRPFSGREPLLLARSEEIWERARADLFS
jgi:fructose-1,6-bisphosphatase/inositol monophosphatase family enzyme